MKTFIYPIFILLLMVSCENEIPFNIKNNPPKLIVNALFDIQKEENEITLALTGREQTTIIKDGSIAIYINGELKDYIIGTDPHAEEFSYESIFYKTKVSFEPGDAIKIVAETKDGVYSAWSEVVVPKPISIEKIDTTVVFYNSWWAGLTKYLRVKTTFTDDGQNTNYYRIVNAIDCEIEGISLLTGNDTIYYKTLMESILINEDIVLTDGRPSPNDEQSEFLVPVQNIWGVFDNSRINGTYTMTTSVPIYPFTGGIIYSVGYYTDYDYVEPKIVRRKLKIRLLSISKMQYFYFRALNLYDSTDSDDILNLPVKFPSNIEGGTGIFGVSTGDEVIIQLEDYMVDDD